MGSEMCIRDRAVSCSAATPWSGRCPTSASAAAPEWIRTLQYLRRLPVDLVVPAHGPVMDRGVIDADERYIAGVYGAVAAAKSSGVGRDELDLPVERFLAEGVVVDLSLIHI